MNVLKVNVPKASTLVLSLSSHLSYAANSTFLLHRLRQPILLFSGRFGCRDPALVARLLRVKQKTRHCVFDSFPKRTDYN